MADLLEDITMENLPPGQREIADVIGFETYIELCRYFGGNDVYVMKYSELLKPGRNKEIMDKFDGFNYEELAREYDLSVRTIYGLVRHIRKARQNAPGPDQISFEEIS